MDKNICRAITFINYHIPPIADSGMDSLYVTVGFFDGMLTERLEVDYKNEELKQLWKYSIKRMDKQLGQYSYQNIFGFSRDEWNSCSDEFFWSEETNKKYPLTFVVFLQLKEYRDGNNMIELQCGSFNKTVIRSIENDGICYTYNTIDKNDFIVCLKCRTYGVAVQAIKELHQTGVEIIYSYSVFSVSRKILAELQNQKYQYVFDENIHSICLKGITNSYGLKNGVSLDQKYYEFCNKLVDSLYEGSQEKGDFKIYDILGDDDFRLIARNVKLGNLLQQFAPGGLLCYEESLFRFYLFSYGVVLNRLTPKYPDSIDLNYIKNSSEKMKEAFQSPVCDQLEKRMENISRIVLNKVSCMNAQTVTSCHAVWQLLQSLKPLEASPAKKYDFLSLYVPFSLLVEILEEKLQEVCSSNELEEKKSLITNEEIYAFIHKISITLHGTLRTDIQFFQIRDFNVIVHYAPAKLRAFYSFWVLRLTNYYNEFNEKGIKNEYSFILSPGMYQEVSVRELYMNYTEKKRLMLIQVPERYLYATRWFPVILAHEVSHFVGYASRQRMGRHFACLKACARVLFLEINYYRYYTGRKEWQGWIISGNNNLKLFDELDKRYKEEEERVRIEEKKYPHEFHSGNSIDIIQKTIRNVNKRYTHQIILEDSERMNLFLKNEKNKEKKSFDQQCIEIQEILDYSNSEYKELLALNQKFESDLLTQLLEILIYICKESYADLIAILTLDLYPEEYIFSFTKGEFNLGEGRVHGDGMLLHVRMGIAMQAVIEMVEVESQYFSEMFCDEWSKDVFKRLGRTFHKDSIESKTIQDIYGYLTEGRDCNKDITIYKPMYNYSEGCFSNRRLDFLKDEVIRDCLMNYLKDCVKAYLEILSNEDIKEMRQNLLATYDKVARQSVSSMSQEIENFLAKYESENKG